LKLQAHSCDRGKNDGAYSKKSSSDHSQDSSEGPQNYSSASEVRVRKVLPRRGDGSFSTLSSSQYHGNTRRIQFSNKDRVSGKLRRGNLSDLSYSGTSASRGSGDSDASGGNSKAASAERNDSSPSPEDINATAAERASDGGDDSAGKTSSDSAQEMAGLKRNKNLMIKNKMISYCKNNADQELPSSSCSDDGDDSTSAKSTSNYWTNNSGTESDSGRMLYAPQGAASPTLTEQAVCPCFCSSGTSEQQEAKREWMNLLESRPRYQDEEAVKLWLLQIMQAAQNTV